MTRPANQNMRIGNRTIGSSNPCFVIAEAGVNHNGNLALALKIVDVAARACADAVKFQTFKAEKLVTRSAPKAGYQRTSSHPQETQFEMLKKLELSWDDHRKLFQYCHEKKILFLSTPFDEESADFLDELGVEAFKMASGELTNLPFLRHVARKQKPMIVSTGMATMEEVHAAVQSIQESGNGPVAILHCVSCYPADPADVNLQCIPTLKSDLNLPVGFSDHTLGIGVAIGAVALGASIIEKHVTLDRSLPGPDHKSSMTPDELAQLVCEIRRTEQALGTSVKVPVEKEHEIAKVARKSVVASQTIPAGATLSRDMLSIRRPGGGISPADLDRVIGKKTRVQIPEGEIIRLDQLESGPG